MIKKVVNKPKTQTVKKFPEIDDRKIYIAEIFNEKYELKFKQGKIDVYSMQNNWYVCSYKDLKQHQEYNINSTIYILNNQQDLARFILGCREFPKVEELEETVGQELAEDEVIVEDVDFHNKIYAAIYGKRYSGEETEIVMLDTSGQAYLLGENFTSNSQRGSENYYFNHYQFYQFDTQEEFLRWALEQTTGKKFRNIGYSATINPYYDEIFG